MLDGGERERNRGLKRALLGLILAAVMIAASGCSSPVMNRSPITDVNRLDGRLIGVALGWGPDYLLTRRGDVDIRRYNSVSGAVTALCYGRLDAIAIERAYVHMIMGSVDGLHMVEQPLATDGIVAYIDASQQELLEDFNAFCREFQETKEFEELMTRVNSVREFVPRHVEDSQTGKPLRLGIPNSNYPYIYKDYKTGEHVGSEMEVARHFANRMGYRTEYITGSYASLCIMLLEGSIDMMMCGNSQLYREDVEYSGEIRMSEVYMPMDIVLIEVEDPQALRMKGSIDF